MIMFKERLMEIFTLILEMMSRYINDRSEEILKRFIKQNIQSEKIFKPALRGTAFKAVVKYLSSLGYGNPSISDVLIYVNYIMRDVDEEIVELGKSFNIFVGRFDLGFHILMDEMDKGVNLYEKGIDPYYVTWTPYDVHKIFRLINNLSWSLYFSSDNDDVKATLKKLIDKEQIESEEVHMCGIELLNAIDKKISEVEDYVFEGRTAYSIYTNSIDNIDDYIDTLDEMDPEELKELESTQTRLSEKFKRPYVR